MYGVSSVSYDFPTLILYLRSSYKVTCREHRNDELCVKRLLFVL